MEEYKIQLTNAYTIEQLADFVESGQVTFDRLKMARLTLQKQKDLQTELERRRKEREKEEGKYKEEEALYKFVDKERTLTACETYFSKYKKDDPYAKHWYDVYAIYELIIGEIEWKKKKVLNDMKAYPERYRQENLGYLLGYKKIDDKQREGLQKEPSPYADFLLSGMTLSYDDLVEYDVIPKEIKKQDLVRPDFVMPATSIKDMGEFPTGRTDVYFFGVPRSGKSSLLSGLVYSLHDEGIAGYESHIVRGKDPCLKYYNGLINCMSTKKPPQGTATDTISFMKLNIKDNGKKYVNRVNFVELSGEAFEAIAEKNTPGCDLWAELGATKCLESKNRKLLFFVLDYSIIAGRSSKTESEGESEGERQRQCLEDALKVFGTDGENNTGKNCTLSKVDTVAIIMTKCDLMDCKSYEERKEMAQEYIDQNFREFMGTLEEKSRSFGINEQNNYKPYMLLFSLGQFYVGNTFLFDNYYSEKIIDFIRTTTRSEKIKGGCFGSIFGRG